MAQAPTANRSEATQIQSTDTDADAHPDLPPLAPIAIRLHLIRHGETEANLANLVLGQGDSPLTPQGLELAARAASSPLADNQRYWKTYCSDLYRAHRTAKIVLGIEDIYGNSRLDTSSSSSSSLVDLKVDSRLRELAKGAREGYPKSLLYEEALSERRRLLDDGSSTSSTSFHVPLLESIEDAWARVKDWIDELVQDALEDFDSLSTEERAEFESCHNNNDDDSETKIKMYNVFALSHSALIRTMIHKLCDGELPKDYAKTREGSLSIPNLSCTRIDIRPFGNGRERGGNDRSKTMAWRPSLVTLTDVSYLNSAASSSSPPYL